MTKKELLEIICEEKKLYLGNNKAKIRQLKHSCHKRYLVFMYLYYFRLCQYYKELRKSSRGFKKLFIKHIFRFYERKKNIFSYKSGVEIGLNSHIGRCCDIWHSGVVINGSIGDNCIFHGNNTIGNKGKGYESFTPTIGNNVDIGVGAVVIGNLNIADNCIIGAGAVVTKSFSEPATVIVGIPGKALKD